MTYTIRYNRQTNHIDGISPKTTGSDNDQANTTGVVSYYAENACGSLTGASTRLARGKSFDDLAEALRIAKLSDRKLCKRCEAAAEKALSAAKPETDWRGASAGPGNALIACDRPAFQYVGPKLVR